MRAGELFWSTPVPIKVFVSYSHRDEPVRDRLRVHLTMLEREGLIETWDDHEIQVGAKIDDSIASAHDASSVFMPIISPDFLASPYCYETEMLTALDKASRGEMTIFSVIAEPCDWLASPLRAFKVAPKDGKAISEWANSNNAYLNIVQELRRIATASKSKSTAAAPSTATAANHQPRLRIKRDFSSIDRGKFRDEAFREIWRYFEASVAEFDQMDGLQGQFEEIDQNAFTCTIVNRAKRHAESHLTVRNNKSGRPALGDITCNHEAHGSANSANETIEVGADEYDLFLRFGMRGLGSHEEGRLTARQVADVLWRDFIQRAGIDYE